jgi:hypothetical protein
MIEILIEFHHGIDKTAIYVLCGVTQVCVRHVPQCQYCLGIAKLLGMILRVSAFENCKRSFSKLSMAKYGQAQVEWFQPFLALPHGIPSPDPFCRVLTRRKPDELPPCCAPGYSW